MTFRSVRILSLLVVLFLVGGATYWERVAVRQWMRPLEVTVYPVNGDGSAQTEAYIRELEAGRFEEIGTFLRRQSARFNGEERPVRAIRLEPEIRVVPPLPPAGRRGALDSLVWSLKLRYYAFRHTPFFASLGRIKLFVVYHRGEGSKPLEHSLGLQKGLIGVVHVFALKSQDAQNNVVIAHELLHTLGATDKYGADGLPVYPDGFAEPGGAPRYPQQAAEIMAGRIPRSPERAEIPESLAECVVGAKTAYEINW